LSLWGADKTSRDPYYVIASTDSSTTMTTGDTLDCKASANPSKSVKGQEITFQLKAENAIAYGHDLIWFDSAAATSFLFTASANSAEILCGTTSLGSASITGAGT
jgi:hypothetical protein